jgi:cysteine-rich repeat protein
MALCSCGTIRAHHKRIAAYVTMLLACCCLLPVASQVPEQCGTVLTGLTSTAEPCRGYYNGAHAGFLTNCGDGYSRGGGCEVNVAAAFQRHDADRDGGIDVQEARGLLPAIGIEGQAMGRKFRDVDANFDGKMTLDEWEAEANTHPPIAMTIRTRGGFHRNFPIESADFGPRFRETLGITYDGLLSIGSPIEGCSTLQGMDERYHNKIVLLTRGTCEFCIKAVHAQARGAKAVMIANSDEELIRMTPGTCGADVTIPSIMIQNSMVAILERIFIHEAHLHGAVEIYFPTCLLGGTVMPGYGLETCDDGNVESGDGCDSMCMLECGNGRIDGAETCDDGNRIDGDGCSSACSLEAGIARCSSLGCTSRCGDGITVGHVQGCEIAGDVFFSHFPLRFAILPKNG